MAGGFLEKEEQKEEKNSPYDLPETMAGINKQKEIDKLFKKGMSVYGDLLRVRYLLTEGEETRSIFVVSKKFGNAVKRNRIRRRIKEAWRKLSVRIKKGLDLAFIPKERIGESKTGEIEKDMERIFKREKILDEN